MTKAKVGDVDLYYEMQGTRGPRLTLFCGLGGHIDSWDHL